MGTRHANSLGWLPRTLSVLLAALALLPGLGSAQVLFSDGFEDGTLAPWTSSNANRSGVSNAAGWQGSGAFGAFTRYNVVTVTSPIINASAAPEARLDIWVRRGADFFSEDTDAGEDLVLEYQRADATWGTLRTWLGSGTNGQIYTESFILPQDALHAGLRIRLRQTGGSGTGFDWWHFDDVVITQLPPGTPLQVGSCDDFENGLGTNWTVAATTGQAGVSSATSQSPVSSMYMNGGLVTVTSNVVDTSSGLFGDLTMWIRRGADSFSEDPDTGEDLVVEYFDNTGSWIPLETFTGAGTPGQIFPRSYTLPAAGRHPAFRVRYTLLAGNGPPWDYWHIDDVCFDITSNPFIQITKMAQTISDPINGTTGPKSIPGAVVRYTIGVTNQGQGSVDADSLIITDVVPAGTDLWVDTSGGDPMTFIDGTTPSGLSFNYATDVTFSNQPGGGPPFNYVPSGVGYDPNVTGFRIQMQGAMNGASGGNNPSFNLQFLVQVE